MEVFKTYFHPEVFMANKALDELEFNGYSMQYFKDLFAEIYKQINSIPQLALRRASFDDHKTAHHESYIEKIKLMSQDKLDFSERPRQSLENKSLEYFIPGYEYSLGGLYEAYDELKSRKTKRTFNTFVAGHHAYSDWGHGYCMVNTLCASLNYAHRIGFKKIVILDWDFHHGDGSQAILAGNKDVFYISIHSGVDLYMYKQVGLEIGTVPYGEKIGHQNIPLTDELYDDDFFK